MKWLDNIKGAARRLKDKVFGGKVTRSHIPMRRRSRLDAGPVNRRYLRRKLPNSVFTK